MTLRARWLASALAVGVSAAGAFIAYLLAGGAWAVCGAVVGAVTGTFAPSVYDGLVSRGTRRTTLQSTVEQVTPRSWARLLDPRLEVVGFVGREHELDDLEAWCGDHRASPVQLITGPGGVGKTRLTVELAERLRTAGWRTERVADGMEAQAIEAIQAIHHSHALLVVDYAEARGGLTQLLNALVSAGAGKIKVLLVARSAGEWWERLGIESPAVWDLLQPARNSVMSISPAVSAKLSDSEILSQALTTFARVLGRPSTAVELTGTTTERKRILDLHAAALVAVIDESTHVKLNTRDVLNELLRHEMHFWFSAAASLGISQGRDGVTRRQLRQAVAAACLLGAADYEQARALCARVPGASRSAQIAEWLRELYPADSNAAEWLGTLQPDRLAELHVIKELSSSPEFGANCLNGLTDKQASRAVMLLARAASDYPEAEDLLRKILPAFAEVVAGIDASADTLRSIVQAIPYPTIILAPAAVALCQRILGLLPDGADLGTRAYWLNLLGNWLSQLGRPSDALPMTEQALAAYRRLADADPNKYRIGVAVCLTNLCIRFSESGQTVEAVRAGEEAVAIYRTLTMSDSDRHSPGLADALSNLANCWSEHGRLDDALAAEREAATIRAAIADTNPRQYRPQLARSLTKLAVRLSELGRYADALPAAEAAVAIYRDLSAHDPDRYRPDLAASVTNLAGRLHHLDRSAEALPLAEESVRLHRELAAANPDRYGPDLADCLVNLSVHLLRLGRADDATLPAEEAVVLYRDLAAINPARHRPHLAVSLSQLGSCRSAQRRTADALSAEEEAVKLLRPLAEGNPNKYQPVLAISNTHVNFYLAALGRTNDAIVAGQEAVAILSPLATSNPARYRVHLATALGNLGDQLLNLNRPADALSPAEQAVAAYRELAAADPDRYRADLAAALTNLARCLAALDRGAEADIAMQEATVLQ